MNPAPEAAGAGRRTTGFGDGTMWAVMAAGLLLRLAPLVAYPDLTVEDGDEPLHYMMGALVPHFGHLVLGQWAPGYETFLGLLFWISGPDVFVARAAQVIVSTISIGLVYAIAKQAGGMRAALIAASLWAIYPSSIAFSLYFFSETLFTTLLLAATHALLASRFKSAGVWFGLATLTRSVALYALPVWIVWTAIRRRPAEARGAAVAFGVALLTILPWTIRNAARYDAFLLVDGTMSSTFHAAYTVKLLNMDLGFEDWRAGPPRRPACRYAAMADLEPLPTAREIATLFPNTRPLPTQRLPEIRGYSTRDFPAAQRCESAAALRFALANPGLVATQYARRIYALWGPNSFLLRAVHRGRYAGGLFDEGHYTGVRNGFVALYLFVIVGALASLGARPLSRATEWFAVYALLYTALHVVAVAWSRYRFPLMPLAIVAAALWLANPQLPASRSRRIALGGLLVAFLGLALHYTATRLP